MATEIYIGAELADCEENVAIVFSSGDIRDITTGQVNSSYQITLPLTKKNRKLLRYVDEINSAYEVDDIGYVFYNGLPVLKGKIIVLSSIREVSATVIIQGTSWLDHFKDKLLSEIDLSAMDHDLTATNVENSWSGSVKAYRYPMILFSRLLSQEYTTSANWQPGDFLPSFRVIDILTAIFSPWTLSGSWLTEAAEAYVLGIDKLAEESHIDGKDLDLKVNSTADNTGNDLILANDTGDATVLFNPVILNNVITDEGSDWIGATDVYAVPESGTYNFKLYIETNWSATNKTLLTKNSYLVNIWLYRNRGGVHSIQAVRSWAGSGDGLSLGNFTFENEFVHFESGDYAYFRVELQLNLTDTSGSNQTVTIFLTTNSELTLTWDRRCLFRGQTAAIEAADYFPDITCLQFAKAVKEAYNLKFTPDYMRQIIYVESGEDAYSTEEKVLSDVDFSPIPLDYIASNYKSVLYLRLKLDENDTAVKEYLKTHSEPYLKKIELTSKYAEKGVDYYENSLFASTVSGICEWLNPPLSSLLRLFSSGEIISPLFCPDYRTPSSTVRLLSWVGLTSGSSWYFNRSLKTSYPKAVTEDMTALFTTNFQKTFRLIDQGRITKVRVKAGGTFLQEFITVIRDINSEGFRPIYVINHGNQTYHFYLNKIEFSEGVALLELIVKR